MAYTPVEIDKRIIPAEVKERIINHVLAQVCIGRSVRRIFLEDDMACGVATFWQWHFADTQLQDKLAQARQAGVETSLDEVGDIADGEMRTKEAIARARLRIETRVKMAQMIAPRKYAPMQKHADPDGNALPPTSTSVQLGDNRVQALISMAMARKANGEQPAIEAQAERTPTIDDLMS